MSLRAEQVSLYFPAQRLKTDTAGANAPARVGGEWVQYRNKSYIRALNNVSVAVERGERVGVIGHNGSGKSTLLRVLAGLYTPQRGLVHINGSVSGIFNMSVGFRQEATGYRNIVIKGIMAGRSRRQIERAVTEIAEFTELGPYLHAPIHTYSQGMALRLAFAITTTFSHEIMIMDEWIGAGDARFRARVVERMESVLENTHILVLASHNNSLMRRLTDRCIWLDGGRVRREGSTDEVIDEYESHASALPASTAVADEPPRLPIPGDYPVLRLEPAPSPGTAPILKWDLERFNVGRVKLTVYNPHRVEEQLVCTGSARGTRQTGHWIRTGMEFRLYEMRDDVLLGAIKVRPADLAAGTAVTLER